MKKTVFTIFLTIAIFVISMSNAYAVDIGALINAGNSISTGKNEVDTTVINIMNKALGVASVLGVAIAFAMLVFVGMKLMSAAPSEKADVKKYLIPYIVGAVCILGSVLILNLISGLGSELNNVMK